MAPPTNVKRFISFFQSKKTLPLGLITLLILHFVTDLFVFIVPSIIKIQDQLFIEQALVSGQTIFGLFIQIVQGKGICEILNIITIFISNLVFIGVLFVAPVIVIRKIFDNNKG